MEKKQLAESAEASKDALADTFKAEEAGEEGLCHLLTRKGGI